MKTSKSAVTTSQCITNFRVAIQINEWIPHLIKLRKRYKADHRSRRLHRVVSLLCGTQRCWLRAFLHFRRLELPGL